MTTVLDYVLLISVMLSGGRAPDRDTLVAIFRSVRGRFTQDEYLQFQNDVRGILGAV